MKILKTLMIALVIWLGGFAAQATPPRIFQSSVSLFAQSPTHIYILRSLRDNSGSHFTNREDLYLTEIDAATGTYTAHWAVASSVTNSVDGYPGEINQLTPKSPFNNPYEIVRLKGASLVQDAELYDDFGYKIKNGSLITNFADPSGASGAKTYLRAGELLALAKSQTKAIFNAYPKLTDEEVRDMSGASMLIPNIDNLYNCKLTARGFGHGDWGNLRIPIKVQCGVYELEPEMGTFEFYVLVPDWRN